MTDEELKELQDLLEGNMCLQLVYDCDDEGNSGFIVEFDNGTNYRGVMHPLTALQFLREEKQNGLDEASPQTTQ